VFASQGIDATWQNSKQNRCATFTQELLPRQEFLRPPRVSRLRPLRRLCCLMTS
jgi:hypothetical protein